FHRCVTMSDSVTRTLPRHITLLPTPHEYPVTTFRTKNSPSTSSASIMRSLSGWRKWARPGGSELARRHRTPDGRDPGAPGGLDPGAPGLAADAPLPLVRLGGQRTGQELSQRHP